jgi:hypothetical protein
MHTVYSMLGGIILKGDTEMEKNDELFKQKRATYILAMVNVGIWAISLIAMVFLIRGSGNIKGLYPILAGGTAVGIVLISSISKIN